MLWNKRSNSDETAALKYPSTRVSEYPSTRVLEYPSTRVPEYSPADWSSGAANVAQATSSRRLTASPAANEARRHAVLNCAKSNRRPEFHPLFLASGFWCERCLSRRSRAHMELLTANDASSRRQPAAGGPPLIWAEITRRCPSFKTRVQSQRARLIPSRLRPSVRLAASSRAVPPVAEVWNEEKSFSGVGGWVRLSAAEVRRLTPQKRSDRPVKRCVYRRKPGHNTHPHVLPHTRTIPSESGEGGGGGRPAQRVARLNLSCKHYGMAK